MIKMIKGTYGLLLNGVVEAMTPSSDPFTLPEAREAELVAAGVAVKVETPAAPAPQAVEEAPEAALEAGEAEQPKAAQRGKKKRDSGAQQPAGEESEDAPL